MLPLVGGSGASTHRDEIAPRLGPYSVYALSVEPFYNSIELYYGEIATEILAQEFFGFTCRSRGVFAGAAANECPSGSPSSI